MLPTVHAVRHGIVALHVASFFMRKQHRDHTDSTLTGLMVDGSNMKSRGHIGARKDKKLVVIILHLHDKYTLLPYLIVSRANS